MNNQNNNLNQQQKKVIFDGATEAPGSGALLNNTDDGVYRCANCGSRLFESDYKFESKQPGLQGWPSFDQAIEGALKERPDNSKFMKRTEVVCANCDGHLGHVFNANDAPSGNHFCINSCALDFEDTDGNKRSGANNS